MRRCEAVLESGRHCSVSVVSGRLCAYHEKRASDLIGELVLTPEEIEATVFGRARRDGRRLDQYTLPAPVEWDGK